MENNSQQAVIAFDLGGTNLRGATVRSDGTIMYRHAVKTPHSKRPEEIVKAIIETFHQCRIQSADYEISAIGAAIPGAIDFDRGIITKSPNLPALDDFYLTQELEQNLKLKVVMENDANAAAIGENWRGASRGSRHSVCLTLGTGVGGGIIINGNIVRGAIGCAGEIGHLCVEPQGHPCGCGSHGCLEQYASATAIVRFAKELRENFSDSVLSGRRNFTSGDVYEAGKKGDHLALEVFRKVGYYLGIAFADLVNVLNPETIVIGGGAGAGWDLFMPTAVAEFHRRAHRAPAEKTQIVPALLCDDAGLYGAARLAL